MVKIPGNPEEIFDDFVSDVKDIFSDHLISVLVTGSVAKGEYVPKKSDINFIIILSEEGMKKIPEYLDTSKKWYKAGVSIPLFLYKEYIESSLDSFPIEFLNIKNNSKTIYGEDLTGIIAIDNKDLRLQVEREIKGKLLKLRHAFFEIDLKPKAFRQFISVSISTFNPIFAAAVYLKENFYPKNQSEIYQKISEIFSVEKDFFDRLIDIKQDKIKVTGDSITPLWEKYVQNIRTISLAIDKHVL
ncbi:hypothetical protein ACFL4T_04495 [candidate division KSB1 bacterium]